MISYTSERFRTVCVARFFMSTSPEDMRYPTDGAALPGESVISESDLAQIVDDHQVALWRYLRALGCDSSEADDLLQDTFLMILRKPFRYVNRAATASY